MSRYCVVVGLPGHTREADNAIVETIRQAGWTVEGIPISRGPEPVVVVSRDFTDDAQALAEAPALRALSGGGAADPSHVHEARRQLADTRVFELIGSDQIGGAIKDLGTVTTPPANGEAEPDAAGGDDAAEPATPAGGETKASTDGAAASPAADTGGDQPKLFATGLEALAVPDALWTRIKPEERAELAGDVVKSLYERRAQFPELLPWLLAPESKLLNEAPNTPALAEAVLKAREGIHPSQLDRAAQETALIKARVETVDAERALIQPRVDLANQAVNVAKELVKQAKRWRALSVWGVIFLVVVLLFAGYVVVRLLDLVDDDKIDGWELAIGIFALALFAISPAVLLIRERPLQGLDQWMPGGKAEKPESGAEKKEEAGSGKAPETKETKKS
jgi:hypothetical protein